MWRFVRLVKLYKCSEQIPTLRKEAEGPPNLATQETLKESVLQ